MKYFISVKLVLTFILTLTGSSQYLNGQRINKKSFVLKNDVISCTVSLDGITSLTSPSDSADGVIIGNQSWGRTDLMYNIVGNNWLQIDNYNKSFKISGDTAVSIIDYGAGMPLSMEQRFSINKAGIDFDIFIESKMQFPLKVGDLAVHFPVKDLPLAWTAWRTGTGESLEYIDQYIFDIFERLFLKHQYISGNGSFLYFTKRIGKPPFLMVLPKRGTKLEYFDGSDSDSKVYIYSELSGNKVPGSWRQKHTRLDLDSVGGRNTSARYGFKIRWVNSYDEMRQMLFDEGLFDIRVVPGMTVPSDLKAQFSLHTKNRIDSITAEFPDRTVIRYIGEKQPHHYVYEAGFDKLGENLLTIHYEGNQKTYLEFFSTEPVETLIKKRASFIVNKQQHRDSTKWYNGLYSVYDMKESVLRGPDNTGGFEGWDSYVVASDDPVLGRAPFLAAKNVYFPVDEEIESLEYYINHFVWNGLQRSDKDDPYPYGIYGVPNWKVARNIMERPGIRSGELDRMQIWRSFDYPHVFMLYYHMYQVAKMYPDKVKYLDAKGYLERAYRTAMAFFKYPQEIWGEYSETYKMGCYNELVVEKIIEDLKMEGRNPEAEVLREEYEKKVKYFIYDDRYPYACEFATSTTAFESSYAFARYGTLNDMKPDTNSWYDKVYKKWYSHPNVRKEDARKFMDNQNSAGIPVRGWLETTYFQLGADWGKDLFMARDGMSYMARMGGWSILDYGINFAEKPYDWLQLGYASYLSSWSLMNTGTPESDYGFWSPGKQNDGAMGWSFMSDKFGKMKGKDFPRGAFYYDGEGDLGNGAAIRIATTVLTDDPLFGWIAYGGILKKSKDGFSIVPKDGVRSRFALATGKTRLGIELERDGFKEDDQIFVDNHLKIIKFRVENRSADKHTTKLTLFTLPGATFKISLDGRELIPDRVHERFLVVELPVSKVTHDIKITCDLPD